MRPYKWSLVRAVSGMLCPGQGGKT